MTKSFERIALPELQIPTLAEDEPSKAEPSKGDSSKVESSTEGTSCNYIHNLPLIMGDFEGENDRNFVHRIFLTMS